MMTPQEVQGMLTWANQVDARLEPNPANVEIWGRAVGRFTPELIREVMGDYMAKHEEKPRPSVIGKLCSERAAHLERLELSKSAGAHDPTKITIAEFRRRHPGELYRKYEEGRSEQALAMGKEYVPLPEPPRWCNENVSVLASTDTDLNV